MSRPRLDARAGPRPSRGTTPRVGVIRHPLLTLGIVGYFFWAFWWSSPGLVFPGVSVLCCVCVCLWCSFLGGLPGPVCVSAVLVLLRRPLRGLASRFCLFGVLLGFPPGSRKTHWGGRRSPRPRSFSASEVLKVESSANLSCEGESHSLSTLRRLSNGSIRAETLANVSCEGASHRTSELSS